MSYYKTLSLKCQLKSGKKSPSGEKHLSPTLAVRPPVGWVLRSNRRSFRHGRSKSRKSIFYKFHKARARFCNHSEPPSFCRSIQRENATAGSIQFLRYLLAEPEDVVARDDSRRSQNKSKNGDAFFSERRLSFTISEGVFEKWITDAIGAWYSSKPKIPTRRATRRAAPSRSEAKAHAYGAEP